MKHLLISISLLLCLFDSCSFEKDSLHFNYFNSFDSTKIAYLDEGEGPVVLLIHGFINDATNWNKAKLKTALLDHGYRVVIPDLRGNGRSDHPHNPDAFKNQAQTKDLIYLINHLDVENYSAVGYSRGSIILGDLLIMDDRISKAVIGGMGLSFTDSTWNVPPAFAAAFLGEEKLNDLTQGALEYARSIHADLKSLGLQQRYQPTTSLEELNKLNIPILILAGDEDLSNGNPFELARAMPGTQFKLVPGDHNNTYKTKAFSDQVIVFLNQY